MTLRAAWRRFVAGETKEDRRLRASLIWSAALGVGVLAAHALFGWPS